MADEENIEPVAAPKLGFPGAVLADARKLFINKKILDGRENVDGITIDGPTSKDLDDAIDLEVRDDAYIVRVSIADVAALVTPDSAVFAEALKRVVTRYKRASNVPMLPRILSENRLSLLPDKRRPVLTFTITLTHELEISGVGIREAALCSRRRFDYAAVDAIIDSAPADPDYKLLCECYGLAQRLMQQRRAHGALAIYDLFRRISTTEEGQIVYLTDENAHKANIIVQEFMILANTAVAARLAEQGAAMLFRNHLAKSTTPDREEILGQFITALANDAYLDTLRQRTALWFEKASYDPVLKGHYGLNLPAYTHVTSPLRRLPDLINHFIIKAMLHERAAPYAADDLLAMSVNMNAVLAQIREERVRRFREQAEKQSLTQVAHGNLGAFAAMDANAFGALLKQACRSGAMSDQFEQALKARFAQGQIGIDHLYAILFENAAESTAWRDMKQLALQTVGENAGVALQLLNILEQNGRIGQKRLDIQTHRTGFAARIIARIGDKEWSNPSYTFGTNKREAEQSAAADFLRRYIADTLAPASTVEKPIVAPVENDNPSETNGTESSGENFVGQLVELWGKHKTLSEARYEFRQEALLPQTKFSCTCIMETLNGLRKSIGSASNKKEAKQEAARKMLQSLSPADWERAQEEPSAHPTEDASTEEIVLEENFVGQLTELCTQNHWEWPVYEFRSEGPQHAPSFICNCTMMLPSGLQRASATAPTKKIAKHYASRDMLALIAACEAAPSIQTESSDNSKVDEEPVLEENYVGKLLDFFVQKGWPPPHYKFTQTGPSHRPSFTGGCEVTIPTGTFESSAIAPTKKNAKQLAAKQLFEKIIQEELSKSETAGAEEPDGSETGGDYILPILELCAARQLPEPTFIFEEWKDVRNPVFMCRGRIQFPSGIEYVAGIGASKKMAKQAAVKELIELIAARK